jgi:predicted amino acid-binding ACT domain protein
MPLEAEVGATLANLAVTRIFEIFSKQGKNMIDVTEEVMQAVLDKQPTVSVALSQIDLNVLFLALEALEKNNEYEINFGHTKARLQSAQDTI